MDLGELRELSNQRLETAETEERLQLATEIAAVVDKVRTYETRLSPSFIGPCYSTSEIVKLAHMTAKDDEPYTLIADIARYNWDDIPTIRLYNSYKNSEGREELENGDLVVTIPIKTLDRGWNERVPTSSGTAEVMLSDKALEDLHSTVMAIGDAASNKELNQDALVAHMGDVMERVRQQSLDESV